MKFEVKCPSCGTPTSLGVFDLVGNVSCNTCGFAANAREFLEKSAAKFPDQAPAGLRPASDGVIDVTGAMRPMETGVRIENMPGYRFFAHIPPAGFSASAIGLILFTVIWCGFMVMWNAMAIRERRWDMLGFGVIHDVIGIGLLLALVWRFVGITEISAEYGRLTRTRKLLGVPLRKVIDASDVSRVELKMVRRSKGGSYPALILVSSKREIGLIANRDPDDMRWLASELRNWFGFGDRREG
ncbi:MAG: hypothetical protein IT350_01765 [Deltaproteobacteria bacterium]|nr:hypothetical protein [Deltaproteobacteria bacterium]